MPTLAGVDGGEHGSVATGSSGIYAATQGSPAITTSNPRTGSRAIHIGHAAGVQELVGYTISDDEVVMSFYVRFNGSLPTGDVRIARINNPNGGAYAVFESSTNRIRTQISTVVGNEAAVTIAADTWYRVDMRFDTTTGTAALDLQVDGVAATQQTRAQAAVACTQVAIGNDQAGGAANDMNADDWIWGHVLSEYPYGAHTVEVLTPTGDGTHNISGANIFERSATGTDITNATTDAYQLVDDVPIDVTPTDYVNQVGNQTAGYVEITLSDLAGGSDVPHDLRVISVERDSAASGVHSGIVRAVDSGGSTIADVHTSGTDHGTTVNTHKSVITRPGGGWSRTNVNGMKIRMGFADGDPDFWISSILVEVAMFPAQNIEATLVDVSPDILTHTLRVDIPASLTDVTPDVLQANVVRNITAALVDTSFFHFDASLLVRLPASFVDVTPDVLVAEVQEEGGDEILAELVDVVLSIFNPTLSVGINAQLVDVTFLHEQASLRVGINASLVDVTPDIFAATVSLAQLFAQLVDTSSFHFTHALRAQLNAALVDTSNFHLAASLLARLTGSLVDVTPDVLQASLIAPATIQAQLVDVVLAIFDAALAVRLPASFVDVTPDVLQARVNAQILAQLVEDFAPDVFQAQVLAFNIPIDLGVYGRDRVRRPRFMSLENARWGKVVRRL